MTKWNYRISNNLHKVKEVSRKILNLLDERRLGESFIFDVKLASEEAMINAIKYGNRSSADKSVRIDCDITKEAIVISVEDEGQGFDYRNLPDPTKDENLTKGEGRGLFLIHNVMDKVEFNSQGNRITMTKFFPKIKGVKDADSAKAS